MLITDFSRSAPFGTARTPITGLPGAGSLESRPDTSFGVVGPTDDIWAAVRLIYFVRSRGENLDDTSKLAQTGLAQMFNGWLERVFDHPDVRPTASDLLQHGLGRAHDLPSLPDSANEVIEGRKAFLRARDRKHPGAHVPEGFLDDLAWTDGQPGAPRPRGRQLSEHARLHHVPSQPVQHGQRQGRGHRPDGDVTAGPAGGRRGGSDGWHRGWRRATRWQRLPRLRSRVRVPPLARRSWGRWCLGSGVRARGRSARLSGTYALELPALDLPQVTGAGPDVVRVLTADGPTGPRRDAIAARARSAEALAALVPALANALKGKRRVVMPWDWAGGFRRGDVGTPHGLADDRRERPVSFRTHVTGHGRDGDTPGLLVTFRPDVFEPLPEPEHGFAILAADIAARFAEDPAALGRMFAEHGLHEVTRLHDRVSRCSRYRSRGLFRWPGLGPPTGPSRRRLTEGKRRP